MEPPTEECLLGGRLEWREKDFRDFATGGLWLTDSQSLFHRGSLLGTPRGLFHHKTSEEPCVSVREHRAAKDKEVVGNAPQASLIKDLVDRRDQFGDLIVWPRHHQDAVRTKVIIVIGERFARQYVCLRK